MSRYPSLAVVVCLQEFQGARRAAEVLAGLLHDPPWVRSITVSTAGGPPRLLLHLAYATPDARLCVPTRVNCVEVVLVPPPEGR